MTSKAKLSFSIILVLSGLAGLALRFYYINFGLPHSFYADEPEISELAIKYTYELKNIILNDNWYKLFPISFVYGTFPAYFYTLVTMLASKLANVFGAPLNKMDLYIFMRSINSLLTFFIAPLAELFSYKMSKNKWTALITFALLALNWKLIVMAHYVNNDILITLFLLASFLFLFQFEQKASEDFKFTLLSAVFFGLAVGTKITALISLPAIFYIFLSKKSLKNFGIFCLLTCITFVITNPFSVIFRDDFIFRMYEMLFKEGGMVFDSVDSSKLKYISALSWMLTLPAFVISCYGIFAKFSTKNLKKIDVFFLVNILIYVLFYSIQQRRVDRWLLPILPILIMYTAEGMVQLKNLARIKHLNYIFTVLLACSTLYYLYFPTLLTQQFNRNTPKSATYLWAKENIPTPTTDIPTRLAYTEEGLDPLNKLPDTKVITYQVYSSENAQLAFPEDPTKYEYVFISSRPMENFKRPEVKKAYPCYAQRWQEFENTLLDSTKFELIKEFALPKPNLIPLSDVYVFKNLNYQPPSALNANPNL